jgi:hypothetical protein
MLQIVGWEGGRVGGREGKIVIPMSEALRAADNKHDTEYSSWKNYCSDNFLSLWPPTMKWEIMKIFISGRPCSLIGFRIYQLSSKSAEKSKQQFLTCKAIIRAGRAALAAKNVK